MYDLSATYSPTRQPTLNYFSTLTLLTGPFSYLFSVVYGPSNSPASKPTLQTLVIWLANQIGISYSRKDSVRENLVLNAEQSLFAVTSCFFCSTCSLLPGFSATYITIIFVQNTICELRTVECFVSGLLCCVWSIPDGASSSVSNADYITFIALHSLNPKLVKMTAACGIYHINTKTYVQYTQANTVVTHEAIREYIHIQ
jgi:hypothetical protein